MHQSFTAISKQTVANYIRIFANIFRRKKSTANSGGGAD